MENKTLYELTNYLNSNKATWDDYINRRDEIRGRWFSFCRQFSEKVNEEGRHKAAKYLLEQFGILPKEASIDIEAYLKMLEEME